MSIDADALRDALEEFQKIDGYHKVAIVDLLTDFGTFLLGRSDLIHRSTISEETARAGGAMRKRCLGLVQVEIDAVSRVEDDLIATGGENDSLSYAGHRASLQMMEAAIRALPLTEEAAHVER